MAPGAGVDLHHRAAGRADPLGIVGGRLIAFHHIDCICVAADADGAFQQRWSCPSPASSSGSVRPLRAPPASRGCVRPASGSWRARPVPAYDAAVRPSSAARVMAGSMAVIMRMAMIVVVSWSWSWSWSCDARGGMRPPSCSGPPGCPSSRKSCTSRDLHFPNLQFLPAMHAKIGAAARAAADQVLSATSRPQSRHSAPARCLDDLQFRTFDARCPWRRRRNRTGSHPASPPTAGRSPAAPASPAPPPPARRRSSTHAVWLMLSSCMPGHRSADPRQLLADQHVDDSLARRTPVCITTMPAGRAATSPIATAPHAGRMRAHRRQHAIGVPRPGPPPPACPRWPDTADPGQEFRTRPSPLSRSGNAASRMRIADFEPARTRSAPLRHRRASHRACNGCPDTPPASPPPAHQRLAIAAHIRLQRKLRCARSESRRHDRRARRSRSPRRPAARCRAEIATPAGTTPIPAVLMNSLSARPAFHHFRVAGDDGHASLDRRPASCWPPTRRRISTSSPSSNHHPRTTETTAARRSSRDR